MICVAYSYRVSLNSNIFMGVRRFIAKSNPDSPGYLDVTHANRLKWGVVKRS